MALVRLLYLSCGKVGVVQAFALPDVLAFASSHAATFALRSASRFVVAFRGQIETASAGWSAVGVIGRIRGLV